MKALDSVTAEIEEKRKEIERLQNEVRSLKEARKLLRDTSLKSEATKKRRPHKKKQYGKPSPTVVLEGLKQYEKQVGSYPTIRELQKYLKKLNVDMPYGTFGHALGVLQKSKKVESYREEGERAWRYGTL